MVLAQQWWEQMRNRLKIALAVSFEGNLINYFLQKIHAEPSGFFVWLKTKFCFRARGYHYNQIRKPK